MLSLTLEKCHIWHDNTPRSGAMNMAIDQLLLECISDTPILRFYQWTSPSVSFGYFESLSGARAHFPGDGIEYIRRWTGGGTVDHRSDLTYTLAIPRTHPWASLRGAKSYHIIHQAVAQALNVTGSPCKLTSVSSKNNLANSIACFTHPVEHDIIAPNGLKLAGAGQKRNRQGLLHQGSVIQIHNHKEWIKELINQLTTSPIPWTPEVSFPLEVSLYEEASKLATIRYAAEVWTNKRP